MVRTPVERDVHGVAGTRGSVSMLRAHAMKAGLIFSSRSQSFDGAEHTIFRFWGMPRGPRAPDREIDPDPNRSYLLFLGQDLQEVALVQSATGFSCILGA